MPQALIIYQSKKGKTKLLAFSFAEYLKTIGIEAKVVSVFKYQPNDLEGVSVLFLGCWTRGRFLMGQKPRPEWVQVVENIELGMIKKVVLFTTYNIATGVMFRNMAKHLPTNNLSKIMYLKSRNRALSSMDMSLLNDYLNC